MTDRARNITNVWITYTYKSNPDPAIPTINTPDITDLTPLKFTSYFDPPASISGKRCRMRLTVSKASTTEKNETFHPCFLSLNGITQPYNKISMQSTLPIQGSDRMDQLGYVGCVDIENQVTTENPEIIVYVDEGPRTLEVTVNKSLAFTIHGSGSKATSFCFCLSFEPIE